MNLKSESRPALHTRSRRHLLALLLLLALSVFLFAGCAAAGSEPSGVTPPPANPTVSTDPLLVIRASGSTGEVGAKTLTVEELDKVRSLAGIAKVEVYLFGTAGDGTVVVGLDPLEAALRTPDGRALTVQVIAGRTWVPGDEADPSAYVGKGYADTHKTALNLGILEMTSPTHSPPVDLGGGTIINVRAVVETGLPEGDAQVYVPLALAQKIFSQADQVSQVYVAVESPEQQEAVILAIQAALGDTIEVSAVP